MIPGLGMFSEAYFIFSIGNIKPILQQQFPACWSKHTVHSLLSLQALSVADAHKLMLLK